MKIKKLLALSALFAMTANSASATIVDGIRQKPVISEMQGFIASTDEDYQTNNFYLYNVDAGLFFTEGNSWGTQVSVASTGLKVAFTVDFTYPEAYLFHDFSISKNSWKLVFFDSENHGGMFVDLGSQANYRWGVEDNGSTFRLYAASEENGNPGWIVNDEEHPAYREGMYMGWNRNSSGNVCTPYLPVEEDNCINWALVAPAVYDVYAAEIVIYDAAEILRAAIEDYKAKGFAGAEEFMAIYLNEAATLAELQQAKKDLDAAFVEWGSTQASVDNPIDLTAKIVNAHFDNGDATTGWSGDAFGRGGTVSDGAEHYSKNYNTYQTITGLKPGIYAVGVNGYYRAGGYDGGTGNAIKNWLANNEASRFAKFYAKAGENSIENQVPIVNVMTGGQAEAQGVGDVEVTYEDENGETVTVYVPNTMAAGDYFFHTLHLYANKVYVAVGEEGELTLGVKKSSMTDADWSMFDDFSLTFYGQGADACNLYLAEALKNFSDYTPDEDVLYTEAYLTAYREALSGDKTANNLEEVNAILGAIDKSYADLMKNIELWKDYQELLTKGTGMAAEAEYEGIDEMLDMMDYIDMESADIINAHELTNEELEAAIAQLNDWIDTILEKSKSDTWEGKPFTKFIKNPGFDEDKDINSNKAEGWNIDIVRSGGNIVRGPLGQGNKDLMESSLGYMNYCFEAWHGYEWDVWQEITGLPVGMYELQVQGYVRCEVDGYTKGEDIEPDYPSPVFLYMNSAQTSFPSVYSESAEDLGHSFTTVESWTTEEVNGKLYPNSMGGAAQCFAWDMYKKQAYGLIAKEGDTFRIGVKMNSDQNWWCIWDNFKLIFHEPTAEIVQPVLEEELAKIDLSKPMGKDVYELAEALKAAALEAIASGDGQEMFKALSDLYDLNDAINTSVALFVRLQKAVENLWDYISASDNESAIADGKALYIEITDGIDNHAITDAEAEAYIDKIAAMKTTLALPSEVANATDSNPVNVTAVIQTPTFDKDYVNSIDGWITAGYNFGNDDTQKGALALEFYNKTFDIHQDIVGLPEGTYEVGVKAFSRNGGTAEDFNTYAENPNFSLAFLYAINGDSAVSSVPVTPLSKGATSEDPAISGETSYTPADSETTYYFPNDMVSAVAFFDMEGSGYDNKVVVKVLADGKLTIGMKKTETLPYCWVLLDSWSLTYYGNNSKLEPNGDASGIEEAVKGQNVRVEYFTLDGRKANGTEKGVVIQKMTFDNGIVLVKKLTK